MKQCPSKGVVEDVYNMNEKNKTLISEERIFGESFIIIRRKYMPSYENRENPFKKIMDE